MNIDVIGITPIEVEQKALSVPNQAKDIRIIDNNTLLTANTLLLAIKDIRKEIDLAFDPIIRKANDAHKEAIAQKKRAEAPLIEAENFIKPQIASYMNEQERIRREAEEKARQEALKAEEERKLTEAVELEKEGFTEEAEAILNETTFIPPPIIPKTTPKLQGTSIKQIWKFRVKNESLIPREYLTVDLVKIGGVVRALKDKANIPGIEVYPEASVASGRRNNVQ